MQEEINNIDKNYICTFKNGKYTDEIRSAHYEMLQSNVSVARCGKLLKAIFLKKVNVDLNKMPRKSLAATMLVEIEALSKMQVFEETKKGDQNILHIDGTKYNFEEIGGFQVSTGSGSYTLGLENMRSGEAQTYLHTFKNILGDMVSLVVPENCRDKSIQKIIFSFKGFMTDHTIMNSIFFNKFAHWRETIIPFVIETYESLRDKQKGNISSMHHVFCGLHVHHDLGIYSEKAILEWEKILPQTLNFTSEFEVKFRKSTSSMLQSSK